MRLANLGGPFEEATAGMRGGVDRIQGTELTPSAVVLDGKLPAQTQGWLRKLLSPAGFALTAAAVVGVMAWKKRRK
jgi:hypothetical protein